MITYDDFQKLSKQVPPNSRIPISHPVYRDLIIGETHRRQFHPRFAESWYARSLMRNAITNYDGIISARAAGQSNDIWWFKTTSITPAAAALWFSLFRSAGTPAAIAPAGITGGTVMNSALAAGPIGIPDPPSGNRYLLTAGVGPVPSNSGFAVFMLVDLLWACNISSFASSPITITGSTVTRYTYNSTPSAVGNVLCIAGSTIFATTAPNPVFTYTNQANTGSRVATQITTTATQAVGTVMPAATAGATLSVTTSQDTGLISVQSCTITTGGTGAFDIYIYRPLMLIPSLAANTYVERDSTVQIDGLQQLVVGSDAHIGCLGFLALSGGTTACATQSGFLRTCYG